jgi:hypothetical protein
MSLRISLAAATVLAGMAVFAAPASAVMQIVPMQDPNAPVQNGNAPDGMFDKSFGDHWQKPAADGQQPQDTSGFHFTMSSSSSNSVVPGFGMNHFTMGSGSGGAATGYGATSNPSAFDSAKQPGSEFYQPMQGSLDPYSRY